MSMENIAKQLSSIHGIPVSAMRQKYNAPEKVAKMREEFINQAKRKGYTNDEIGSFLDFHPTSISRIAKPVTPKTQRLLQLFKRKEKVMIKPKNYYWIPELRKRGHCIVNVAKYQYKLITQ